MQHFFALRRSVETARAMFQNLEVMKEFEKFARCMKPVGRRIMLPLEWDSLSVGWKMTYHLLRTHSDHGGADTEQPREGVSIGRLPR
jgi:hypothetical protein